MKRVVAFFLMLFILAGGVSTSYAASGGAYKSTDISVFANGGWVDFPKLPLVKNDKLLVPVRALFEKIGARVDWYPNNKSISVVVDNKSLLMKVGDKRLNVNNTSTNMDLEPILVNGVAMVPLRFTAESLGIEVNWDASKRAVVLGSKPAGGLPSRGNTKKNFKVVIDPGHGGKKEPGAVYWGTAEKDLNLDISKRLNKLLQAEGISTYMTRGDDRFLSLYPRSNLANSINADLLVSVHNNASRNRNVRGSMTLYYPGNDNSKGNLSAHEFAAIVQRNLTSGLGTANLGVIARPNLAVLRTADMPAVIAEVGYMSNSNELNKLKTAEFRQKAAEALKKAIMEALNNI